MGRKDKPVDVSEEQGHTIGAFLRQQRQAHHITLTHMAEKTGYSKTYLSAIENGNIRASQNVVKQYTRHLDLAPEQIPATFQDLTHTTSNDELQERPWNVPYRRNSLLVGRHETLERLHNRLFGNRKLSHILAITGLGGIGKTQLVTEYAYAYRAHYQGIFWIRGDSTEVMMADFTSLPITTGLLTETGNTPEQPALLMSTGDFTKKWLRQHPACLLIVDNLDDAQNLVPLTRLITQVGESRIIITTRLQIPAQIAQNFELGSLSIEDSALFLLRRINALPANSPLEEARPEQRSLASEIARLIDGIPLALDQAGSYIEESGCDLGHYLRLFKQQGSRLLNERGGFALDHPEPIATTWLLAFQKIQQQSEVARDLLYLCAFLHPDAIYRELIQQGAQALGPFLRNPLGDPVSLDQAISALRKYSILRKTDQANTLTIHRLVQAVIRENLDELSRLTWAERTVRLINAAFPRITATDWLQTRTLGRKYYAQAQTALDIADHQQMTFPEVAQLLSKVGKYLEETSDFEEAEKRYLAAIALNEHNNGSSADTLTQDYNNLALLYEQQEKYRQAEDYYKKALSSRQGEITRGSLNNTILETLRNYTTFLMKFEQRKNEASRLRAHTTGQLSHNSVRHITVNDDHAAIVYQGHWELRHDQYGEKSGDYGGNTHFSDIEGASFQYTFTGFGIAILSDTASALGILDIYIDDRYVQRIDTRLETEQQPQTIIYHQEQLQHASHTIRGELVSGTFALDAFVVFTYEQFQEEQ